MAGQHIINMVVRITPEEYIARYMSQGNSSLQTSTGYPIIVSQGMDTKVIIFALAVVAISVVALVISQSRQPCTSPKAV